MGNRPRTSIAEVLDSKVATEKKDNTQMLLKIIQSLHYLAQQGMGIRGSYTNESDFTEANSNFTRLLLLISRDVPQLNVWLAQKKSYISPQIQNELLQFMSHHILRKKLEKIKEHKYFTIMVDETRDISNCEQAVVCLRHVGDDLVPIEDFIGFFAMNSLTSNSIVNMILDVLTRSDLKVENARGQCYDGAASMKGSLNGVAKQILDKNDKALYIHCYGHSLNLAVQDAVKENSLLRDTLDVCNEIIKLIKNSSKRQSVLDAIKEDKDSSAIGIRTLCPTRYALV